MSFSVIIVAAGSGTRAGAGLPKTWRQLAGKPVVVWSAEAFAQIGAREIIVVVSAEWLERGRIALAHIGICTVILGGSSRAGSVRAGLSSFSGPDDETILVHDGARPFVAKAHVDRLLSALDDVDGAILALPVSDTLKRGEALITGTLSRDGLWRAQTPQAFRRGVLAAGYQAWDSTSEPTDDAGVIEAVGGRIAIAVGDPMLMKLTYLEDFEMAERLLVSTRMTRIGQGIDAHRWGPGDGVWLCGVHIVHDQTLVGHSDADAGLHALTDALLGAIGDGDIGQHFPPTEEKWRGASSDKFLTFAVQRIAERGGHIANVDVTLVCEQPKISPHREEMRTRIANLLGIPVNRVSVKATTMEGMGFTGRSEGLLAQAIASVNMPAQFP